MHVRFVSTMALLVAFIRAGTLNAADTLIVYHITGINGGPPTHTLYVYDDSTVELHADSFTNTDTIYDTLGAAEMQELVGLFTDNDFQLIDTMQFSGCLSCPEFSVTYLGRRVSGNTPARDGDLAAILTGLNGLVSRLLRPAGTRSLPMCRPTAQSRPSRGAQRLIGVRGPLVGCRVTGDRVRTVVCDLAGRASGMGGLWAGRVGLLSSR